MGGGYRAGGGRLGVANASAGAHVPHGPAHAFPDNKSALLSSEGVWA